MIRPTLALATLCILSLQPRPAASQPPSDITLHHFRNDGHDGYWPEAGLVWDGSKFLYGTTSAGGSGCGRPHGCGTVFSIERNGVERIVHAFNGDNGSTPMAGVIKSGTTLYGTTSRGGHANAGTVFAINSDNTGERVLHDFEVNGTDGANPVAGLILNGGTLYGTTLNGGTYDDGTVFAVDPATGAEIVIHAFKGRDGAHPAAGLFDLGGMLYGTTRDGGAHGLGTVFKIAPDGTETVMHSFANNGRDGIYPIAALTEFAGDDKLYGTTLRGGSGGGGGTVFRIEPDSGAEHVIHSFGVRSRDGSLPDSVLYEDPRFHNTDVLLGMTYKGGGRSDGGTLFSVDPANGDEYVDIKFNGGGDRPIGAVIDLGDSLDHFYYGTTSRGDSDTCRDGCGTVFQRLP